MNALASSGTLLPLVACTGPASVDTGGPDDDGGSGHGRFIISGIVVDLDGDPVVDVFVTVSTEFCTPDRTDEAGAFAVGEVDPGDKRLITYGETASNGLFASVVFPFEADEALHLEAPIRTPALVETWPVDPSAAEDQVVMTADGLALTIPAGALTLAPFAPAEVQVARVPVELAPPFIPEGVDLLDLFVLHPIQSTFDPPAPVAFPADTALPPGAAVRFHALDYDTGLLVPVASGTVDADGRPVTDDGAGIPELTWVGVSLE